MKKKIYNKKNFWSGIVFLVLAGINIPLMVIKFQNLDTIRIIKSMLIITFCILFGATSVYRSLNSKCNKEDMQNDDEREKEITLKSKSSAYNVTFTITASMTIISAIAFGITRNDVLMGIFIGSGIVPSIMAISGLCGYFYYDKRN
jgi:nucleoside recognition membrane protein YjiH